MILEQAEEYAIEQLWRMNFLQEQQRLLQRAREQEQEQEQEPEFTFRLPEQNVREDENVFGVAPPDPRYYEPLSGKYLRAKTEFMSSGICGNIVGLLLRKSMGLNNS